MKPAFAIVCAEGRRVRNSILYHIARQATCSKVAAARPGFLNPRLHNAAQTRLSSHSPVGSSSTPQRKRVTLQTLRAMYQRGEPIAMLTAQDFPSAHAADHAGMDIVLVGDSLAMVALGMDDTGEVTVEDMLLHCKSVSRGAKSAFVVS